MTTMKYFSQTLLRYFLSLIGLLVLSLVTLAMGMALILFNPQSELPDSSEFYKALVKDQELVISDEARQMLQANRVWLMVLNQAGQIEEAVDLPEQLQHDYELTELVSMSRWYLEDYPVFSYVVGEQVVVLGYPKSAYWRYPLDLQSSTLYKIGWLLLAVFVIVSLACFVIYFRSRLRLLKDIAPITQALDDLAQFQPVYLEASGSLSEIKSAVNQTSDLLLATKDMQNHWVRGISHDLRNPLTLMMGYSYQLEQQLGPRPELTKLQTSIHKMEQIISDLNMSYLLDSQQVKQDLHPLDLTKLLRQIAVDFLNEHEPVQLEIDLPEKNLQILGQEGLLTRAVQNCLLNSIEHNPVGTDLSLSLAVHDKTALLILSDTGTITPEKVAELENKTTNYDSHGMGVVITKQIIQLHGGEIHYSYGKPGLCVHISLPLL